MLYLPTMRVMLVAIYGLEKGRTNLVINIKILGKRISTCHNSFIVGNKRHVV